jgi:hypothetical protein
VLQLRLGGGTYCEWKEIKKEKMEKIEGQFFANEKSCPLNPSPFLNAHQLGTTLMPGQLKIVSYSPIHIFSSLMTMF